MDACANAPVFARLLEEVGKEVSQDDSDTVPSVCSDREDSDTASTVCSDREEGPAAAACMEPSKSLRSVCDAEWRKRHLGEMSHKSKQSLVKNRRASLVAEAFSVAQLLRRNTAFLNNLADYKLADMPTYNNDDLITPDWSYKIPLSIAA